MPVDSEDSPLIQSNQKALTKEEVQEIVDACTLLVQRYVGEPIWDSTLAEIVADPINRSRQLQKELGCGNLMHNRAKCAACGDIIQSMTRHDFVSCECGKSFVDGGTWYCRMGGMPENMLENWPWVKYGKDEA